MTAQKFITEANKHEVCKLLGITEQAYCQYQEQNGQEYMQQVMGSDDWGIDQMAKNFLFWRWWINHWNKRDEEFLIYAKDAPHDLRLKFYHSLNSVEGFEFFPHKSIMQESHRLSKEGVIPFMEVQGC